MSDTRRRDARILGDSLDGAPMSAATLAWLTIAFVATLVAIAAVPALVPPPAAATLLP